MALPSLSRMAYFYPRPPRGGRQPYRAAGVQGLVISIHALREEGDPGFFRSHPARIPISIHALREEGDLSSNGKM